MPYIKYFLLKLWLIFQGYYVPMEHDCPMVPPTPCVTPELDELELGGFEGEDEISGEWEYIR